MHYDAHEFDSNAQADTLLVVLHGLRKTAADMCDVVKTARATLPGGVSVYAPTLPYSKFLDSTGADDIVLDLVEDLDEIWKSRPYDNVIFIGHSLGGVLLRRVFLAGAPHAPDYSGKYVFRDDLLDKGRVRAKAKPGTPSPLDAPHPWAPKVRRLVMMASWDKGWTVSERGSWYYNLGLNALGFLGRVAELIGDEQERQKLGRTMLDARRGAPFIVQTRLLWMAYRRWHIKEYRSHYVQLEGLDPTLIEAEPPPEAVNPMVVQIIGTGDNFVSPQDQVDADIDGADWSSDGPRRYCLMEMPATNHVQIVDFGLQSDKQSQVEKNRLEVFKAALTTDGAAAHEMPACVRDPRYFEDIPTPIDSSVENIVFVMHGIRDDGYWTHRIAKAIKEEAEVHTKTAAAGAGDAPLKPESIRSFTPTYGYFPMGAFIMPWIRQQKVEWFMDLYVNVKARFPKATMHFVGHSNGTYLAAKALEDYRAARFGRIYFAGCVVHPTFDWRDKIDHQRLKRLHNARGGEDWVVAFLPKSLEYFADLGGGGFDGFDQIEDDSVELTQSKRFALGGHSGAIEEGHWSEIAKFIVTGEKPFGKDEKTSPLFTNGQTGWIAKLGRLRIGVPLAFSAAAMFVLFAFSLWLPFCNWQWGARESLGGWGYPIWFGALALFLVIQYLSKKPPPKPVARGITFLLLVIGVGVASFFFTSLIAEAREFLTLESQMPTAGRAIGAAFTLAGLLAIIRFVLTRF